MLCQKCGQKQATTYFQQTVNGQTTTMHLCDDCAAKMGLTASLSPFDLGNFFSGFFQMPAVQPQLHAQRSCDKCGATFDEIVQTGLMGCDRCYQTFAQELRPTLENLHGKVEHVGKISSSAGTEFKTKQEIAQLTQQMNQAVNNQENEKAASLRDQIKDQQQQLEKGEDQHD